MTENRELTELASAVGGAAAMPLGALAKAYIAAKLEMPALVAKHLAKGDKFSYKYSKLSDVYDVCEEAFGKHGIAVFQDVYTYINGPVPEVECFTTLYHAESDQFRAGGRVTMRAMANAISAQDVGKLISYARRYSLLAAAGLANEPDDDDGQSVSQPQALRQNGQQKTNGQYVQGGRPSTQEDTPAQKLERLGKLMYGVEWPKILANNALTKFGVTVTEVGQLNSDQIEKFIKGLKTLKAQSDSKKAPA